MNNMQDTLIIEAGRTEAHYWRDLWRYRELFYFLAWRDILVRYKQTVIGVAWAVIRPFLTMVIFTVVFGSIAKLPSDGVPYPLFVMAAPKVLPYDESMASRVTKQPPSLEDLLPPLPPEGPELDALIRAAVAKADANPAPGIPMAEVFEGLRNRHAERLKRGP